MFKDMDFASLPLQALVEDGLVARFSHTVGMTNGSILPFSKLSLSVRN